MRFHRGQTVIVREMWRGRLWSAVPHIWVEDDITYVPQGTVGAYASNRDLAYSRGMTREQRKLAAMRTLDYRAVERSADLSTLHFFMPGNWARVNLGWTDDEFLGWYVNFETPVESWDGGLQSKDLVLDLQIAPDGRWRWKDQDSFDTAVVEGVLPGDLLPNLEAAAAHVLEMLDQHAGPFDPGWREWTADPAWTTPMLPADMRAGGAAWTLREAFHRS